MTRTAMRSLALGVLLCVVVAPGARAASAWIPTVAHNPGSGDSVWRSDLSLLNLCPETATVELTLHSLAGAVTATCTVEGSADQVLRDVVGMLTSGDASGALEVRSDRPLLVSSRTYTLAAGGTFGQSLDGVAVEDGLDRGESAFLHQLEENGSFRTNIGLLNMSLSMALVEVSLFDGLGGVVGTYRLPVNAGRSTQDLRPFASRFGRSDIAGGYARVTVVIGGGIYAYASVVDNATHDPTTVTMRAAPDCDAPLDIRDRLAAVEGMSVTELSTGNPGYRQFRLGFVQPSDHGNPAAGQLSQLLTLHVRSDEAPVVLEVEGFTNANPDQLVELTTFLEGNQLKVEHRFFGGSTPDPADWSLLTLEQAASDLHRIVSALRPILTGAWISTGHGKGGLTAVCHRRHHPGDVDGTLAYSTAISLGAPDERYLGFLAGIGTTACRERLLALQHEALARRQAMLDLMATSPRTRTLSFARIGGADSALEAVVLELPFSFWQFFGGPSCADLPEVTDGDQALFETLDAHVGFATAADPYLGFLEPYYYQARTELGYPALPTAHLADLLRTGTVTLEAGLLPDGVTAAHDPAAMTDLAGWVATQGSRLLFLYGEDDPVTAGAVDLGDAVDSYRFVIPDGNDGVGITSLTAAEQAQVVDILERWTSP